MEASIFDRLTRTTSLEQLYPLLAALRMTPGWNKKRPSLWKQPRTQFRPLHWRYDIARVALDQSGLWIGTDLAERRNFLLFNPVGDNDYDTVRTLVVAFQMIKPGEYARPHRHTPNAMRLILDAGPGCYTVVDGVKLPMRSGDFLLTPGGCWHSHYNEGEANAYWIDILDVPLVHLLEPMFFEEAPGQMQEVVSEPIEHPFYFAAGSAEQALARATVASGLAQVPLPTQEHIPTIEVCHWALEATTAADLGCVTSNRVFLVTQGQGEARIGDLNTRWSRGDVLAIPAWTPASLRAQEEARLYEVSDAPVMRKLGFFRSRQG